MSKKCISCGTVLNDNDKFCGECGSKQPETASVCPNCNKEVPAGSKFCPECGTPLQASASPASNELVYGYSDCTISCPDDCTIAITIKGVTFNMKLVEGGRYDEMTQVSDFYIGETVVTQELWQMIMGDNPSKDNRDMQLPVTDINPAKCSVFFNKLLKITGVHFDFPTIYQWEYAHDGGRKATRKTKYAGSDVIDEVAWTVDNSSNEIQPVALLKANELGLYDMDGNVQEYCRGKYCKKIDYRFNPAHNESAVPNGFSAQSNNPKGLRFVINVPISEHILTQKMDNASIFSPAIEKDSPLHDALCQQQQKQDYHLQKEIEEEIHMNRITSYNVVLRYSGANLFSVIKEMKQLCGLSLYEAKNLAYDAPSLIMESVDKKTAEKVKKHLENIGAEVEIRPKRYFKSFICLG